ncbi:MAG: ABC-F family ATP-binding cassette domain-containing protein [Bacteroidales bacterium]|nr:ABC-F family ATP-binding cassette domain-containing protein [Bacteroidales bacterium]
MEYLRVDNLTKAYGNKILFENISFVINKKEKFALIAKNGTGKTSLLNIITGKDISDSGKVSLNNSISVAYLEQEPVFFGDNTVIEQVFNSSGNIVNAVKDYERAMQSQNEKEIRKAVETMDRLEAWEFEREIKTILTKLKITDFEKKVKILSGGQKKRLALANALLNKPDFLMLDEPTNHLDFEMIEWLEDYLSKSDITVLTVTHDRYFLDKICNRIIEIDDNELHLYKGNYAHYLVKRQERINISKVNIEKARNLLRIEAQWMSKQPKARATKAKHRINNYYKIKEKAGKKTEEHNFNIEIEGKRLGKKIIDIDNINKAYDENILIDDFSYKFVKEEKIAIVGNNGVGKSTFLNLIAGKIKSDSGTVDIGETVSIGYFEQSSMNLPEDKHMIEVIRDQAELIKLGKNREMSAAQFAEYFLFPRNMHYNFVSQLSGGEKRRLYLMTVLMKNPNFLILDEPTNDLDIMTLNVLEDYIRHFKGTVLLVSHDRYFIDKTADTLFVFKGLGEIKVFPGNYSAYIQYVAKNEKNITETNQKKIKQKPEKRKEETGKQIHKLSYKEKTEFKTLDEELERFNKEKSELELYMQSGNYTSEELAEKSKRLAELIEIIDEKEMRWLELSEKV